MGAHEGFCSLIDMFFIGVASRYPLGPPWAAAAAAAGAFSANALYETSVRQNLTENSVRENLIETSVRQNLTPVRQNPSVRQNLNSVRR